MGMMNTKKKVEGSGEKGKTKVKNKRVRKRRNNHRHYSIPMIGDLEKPPIVESRRNHSLSLVTKTPTNKNENMMINSELKEENQNH